MLRSRIRAPLALLSALASLALARSPARGATPAPAAVPPASPCDRPEVRQFDFWLGDWSCYTPDGKLAGTNRIEKILGGCVVLENWKSQAGPDGKSFNLWTARDSSWHQTWVSSVGALLTLSGRLRDGKMVLEGPASSRQPPGMLNRITWTPKPNGEVEQKWETSTDEGATWTVGFLGLYRKQTAAK